VSCDLGRIKAVIIENDMIIVEIILQHITCS
jgi:hypothetical protein